MGIVDCGGNPRPRYSEIKTFFSETPCSYGRTLRVGRALNPGATLRCSANDSPADTIDYKFPVGRRGAAMLDVSVIIPSYNCGAWTAPGSVDG